MKVKRFLIVAMAVCLCAAFFAGCSQTPVQEQQGEGALEQISDEGVPLAESAGGYETWGKTEWESASEDQKNEVCIMLLRSHTPELESLTDEEILAAEESMDLTKTMIDQLFLLDENATIAELMG